MPTSRRLLLNKAFGALIDFIMILTGGMKGHRSILLFMFVASAAFAQQEYRIGWTRVQFDSAFKGYKYHDLNFLSAKLEGVPAPDTTVAFVYNYKVGGVKGVWLRAKFVRDTVVSAEWDVNVKDKQTLPKLVKYLDRKFGKRYKTYLNVDDEMAWVNKLGEVYILRKSDFLAAEGLMFTLETRKY